MSHPLPWLLSGVTLQERWSLFQMICLSGVRGLQTAILMVYWLSAVSGLRLSAMSLTKLPAAVTSLSERQNASHFVTCAWIYSPIFRAW